jgi:LuxR family transcriptional regulator, quorum-sensing system regulator BjaR1
VSNTPCVALDLIDRLENITSPDEVWRSFLAFSSNFGLRFGTFSEVPRPGEAFEDVQICLSWPEEWTNRYKDLNYLRNDPAVLNVANTVDPYTWSEALEFPGYTKGQRRVVAEASEFGMTDGFVIPLLTFDSGPRGIALGGSHIDLSLRDRAELQLAAVYAHAKIKALIASAGQPLRKQALSQRERECLHWVAAGKSDWQIGEILTISEKTVHHTVERAKRKFGVATRVQAVVAAMRAGTLQV